jgi:hypothetical protein
MFKTFAAAFLLTALVACNKGIPVVKAQSQNPSYDNVPPVYDDSQFTDDRFADDYDSSFDESATIETTEPPPPLPEYEQPEAPAPDYYWTPGYWAWGPGGYYWVPGEWVLAPWVGAIWTPPYWDFTGGRYLWHAGYWGMDIGFYGGINYGFGYPGRGYYGSYWNNGHLFYNRSVNRLNGNVIHNIYKRDVPRVHSSRSSFRGGHSGLNLRPTDQERRVIHERRAPAQPVQVQTGQRARQQRNRTNFAAPTRQRNGVGARPQNRPAIPRQTPQEPRVRPETPQAPQRHEFHPAPHPAPVSPQQQPQQRQQQRQAAPQRRSGRPDLQNHLELQQQRPAPRSAAPRATQPPAPQATPRRTPQIPAPHAAPQTVTPRPAPAAPAGPRRNGGEQGRGRGNR